MNKEEKEEFKIIVHSQNRRGKFQIKAIEREIEEAISTAKKLLEAKSGDTICKFKIFKGEGGQITHPNGISVSVGNRSPIDMEVIFKKL